MASEHRFIQRAHDRGYSYSYEVYTKDPAEHLPAEKVQKESILKIHWEKQPPWVNTLHNEWLEFQQFTLRVTESQWFGALIMATIMANAISLAVETDEPYRQNNIISLAYVDFVFTGIYTAEFLLKVAAQPKGYWQNAYNKFDFVILMTSYVQIIFENSGNEDADITFLRVARALRALRALRSVAFLRSLKVIVNALVYTFKKAAVDLFILLALFMFLFAIIGYYFFGFDESGDQKYWGSLASAFMSLLTYVTSDSWYDLQKRLLDLGFSTSPFYALAFMFFGHFIFTNLFIGVIITNVDDATKADQEQRLQEKIENVEAKKEILQKRQEEEIKKWLSSKIENDFTEKELRTMIEQKINILNPENTYVLHQMATSLPWLETFTTTMEFAEKFRFRTQMLHFEIANTLAQLVESQVAGRIKQ